MSGPPVPTIGVDGELEAVDTSAGTNDVLDFEPKARRHHSDISAMTYISWGSGLWVLLQTRVSAHLLGLERDQ
jgi:hypothetical protein